MKFELQLWSIGELTKKSFPDALKLVKEWGYSGVEFAGFGEHSAEEMKSLLEENGLYAMGAHISFNDFENNFDYMLDYCKTIGAKYMIIPCAELKTEADLKKLTDLLNSCADKASQHGIKVGYHNHAGELGYIGDRRILDAIAEDTNENVVIEPDVFWIEYAGVNAVEYIKMLGKKAEVIHLKQIAPDGKTNVAFPDGTIDMKEIIEASEYATNFIVEQEGSVDKIVACSANAQHLLNL